MKRPDKKHIACVIIRSLREPRTLRGASHPALYAPFMAAILDIFTDYFPENPDLAKNISLQPLL